MRQLVVLLGMAVLFSHTGMSAYVIEGETVDYRRGRSATQDTTVTLDGDKLAIESRGRDNARGHSSMIFRGDRDAMLHVNHVTQTYFVMDEKFTQSMSHHQEAAKAQMQKTLADVPADRRAMVEQMMQGRMASSEPPEQSPKVATEVDETKQINGYLCMKYEVSRDGERVQDVWVVRWEDLGLSKEDFDVVGMMASFQDKTLRSMQSGARARRKESSLIDLEALNGFPLLIVDYDDEGVMSRETKLQPPRKKVVDDAVFDVPPSYTEKDPFAGQTRRY